MSALAVTDSPIGAPLRVLRLSRPVRRKPWESRPAWAIELWPVSEPIDVRFAVACALMVARYERRRRHR